MNLAVGWSPGKVERVLPDYSPSVSAGLCRNDAPPCRSWLASEEAITFDMDVA
jgi:hypothetical protein